jgi:hypothetical protein
VSSPLAFRFTSLVKDPLANNPIAFCSLSIIFLSLVHSILNAFSAVIPSGIICHR